MSPDLATALRAETPAAPSELRERVALIAGATPPPRRMFPIRRIVLFAAPAAAAVSLVVAFAVGVRTAATNPPVPAAAPEGKVVQHGQSSQALEKRAWSDAQATTLAPALRAAAPGPSRGRAQHVNATLSLLVDDSNDLSATTQRALRITRRLGGYVQSVQYGTQSAEGTATLHVRIPVSRVQAAVVGFSNLGRILAQQTQITDLQQRLDELTRQIRRAKGDKARIRSLRRERVQISRQAAYATVNLDLTTHEQKKQAASPSRFDRAVDDASGILASELAIGTYALIVASPFLILLAAALGGNRAYRRYADQRLLERA